VIFKNLDRISATVSKFLRKTFDFSNHRSGFHSKADRWLEHVVGFLTIAGAVAGAVAFARAVAGAGAFASTFAVTLAVGVGVATDANFLFVMLFVLLPISNAVADLLSLAATRRFMSHLKNGPLGRWTNLWHVVFDVLIGVACLLLLLAMIVGLLEAWQAFMPGVPPVDWRAYWDAAMQDWRAGSMLWLMCFTTLLPTLTHLALGGAIIFTQKSDHTRRAVALIRQYPTLSDAEQPATAGDISHALLWGHLSGIGHLIVRFAVFIALVTAVTYARHSLFA